MIGRVKRVLVTGHDGYVGAVLVPQLVKKGYDVTGLDTFYYEDCWFGDSRVKIKSVRKDIRDIEVNDLKQFDAIIHLAALSNDPLGQLSAKVTLDIDYHATVRLAEFAKQAGVQRFLYASSCSLYGKSDKEWMDETSPMAPLTAYAESKVKAEQDLQKLSDSHFAPIILRCATIFGVSPKLRVDLVVNNLTAWGITTGKIRILSDGTPWRPLIHVEDLAAAYEFFLHVPVDTGQNQVFNIGFNTHNYKVRTIAELVTHILPGTEVVFSEKPDRDARSYRVRFDNFHSLFGLEPQWDLEGGILQIVEAYRKHRLMQEDFFGRKYVRLNQIQYLMKAGRLDSELRWRKEEEN